MNRTNFCPRSALPIATQGFSVARVTRLGPRLGADRARQGPNAPVRQADVHPPQVGVLWQGPVATVQPTRPVLETRAGRITGCQGRRVYRPGLGREGVAELRPSVRVGVVPEV